PPLTTASTTATFMFDSVPAGAGTFQCAIDESPFVACSSPITYSGLAATYHRFRVAAGSPPDTTPRHLAGRHPVQALLAGHLGLVERRRIDAVLVGEADRGLGRRPVGGERGLGRRADHALAQIRLAIGQLAHHQGQATRRAERRHLAVSEARLVEPR